MLSNETTQEITQLINRGELDTAEERLDSAARSNESNAQYWLLKGQIANRGGEIEDGMSFLNKAIELDPDNVDAVFRLAYSCDLRGDDDKAIELYERCVSEPPMHVNAMINLAVLYEDHGRYDEAETYLKEVLRHFPNHKRAAMFLKDVESSQDMYYDEDLERTREKHDAVLYTPISDFELSVRSRNCLKKMNIHTLGDLLNTTEHELLSYKNFGETSLNEIKAMLVQKGLRIGQMLEQEHQGNAVADSAEAPIGDPAVLSRPVSALELSVRARKCLQRLGLVTLGDVAARTEAELLGSKNFGETSLLEIRQRLSEHGLSLRQLSS